jgi:hypothetical protein
MGESMDLIRFAINLYLKNQSLYKREQVCINIPDVDLGAISLERNNHDPTSESFDTCRVFEEMAEDDIIEIFLV